MFLPRLRRRTSETGSANGYVTPAQLKAERDAREAVDNDLERAARQSLSLSDTQAQAFRHKIGAEAEGQRDYTDTEIGTWSFNSSPRSDAAEDTGLVIPDGATTLVVRARAGDLPQTVDVAELMAKPGVAHGNALSNTNSILIETVDADEPDDTAPIRIAHGLGNSARDIYFRQTSAGGTDTATFWNRVEDAVFTEADRIKLAGIEANADATPDLIWANVRNKPILPSVNDSGAQYKDADKVVVLEDSDVIIDLEPGTGGTYRWSSGTGGVIDRRSLTSDTALYRIIKALRWDDRAKVLTVWLPQDSTSTDVYFENRRFVITNSGNSTAPIPWGRDSTQYKQVQFGAANDVVVNDFDHVPLNVIDRLGNSLVGRPRLRYATLPTSEFGQSPILSGPTLPNNPHRGQLFRLLAQATAPQWAEGTLSKQPTSGGGFLDTFTPTNADTDLPVGRPNIVSFINYTGGRIDVWPTAHALGNSDLLPASIQTLAENGTKGSWTLSRNVRKYQTPQFTKPWAYGDVVGINITLADGTKWVADAVITPGLVVFDGYKWAATERSLTLDAVDARIDEWARVGNTAEIPDAKLRRRALTQAEYNALGATADANTLYLIKPAN